MGSDPISRNFPARLLQGLIAVQHHRIRDRLNLLQQLGIKRRSVGSDRPWGNLVDVVLRPGQLRQDIPRRQLGLLMVIAIVPDPQRHTTRSESSLAHRSRRNSSSIYAPRLRLLATIPGVSNHTLATDIGYQCLGHIHRPARLLVALQNHQPRPPDRLHAAIQRMQKRDLRLSFPGFWSVRRVDRTAYPHITE